MITVFLEPMDWVPSKRSLYADKGGKGIAGSDNTLTEESFSFPFGKKDKETGLERTRSEYETGRRSRLRHFRRHWKKQRTIQRTDDHPILCADVQLGRRPRRRIPG